MTVSKRTRYEVLKRDNHTCRYCGATAPDAKITIDHVVPVTLGGSDEPSNLVTACHDCNAGKTSTSPTSASVEDVKQDALRWAAAIKLASEQRDRRIAAMNTYGTMFLAEWDEYCDDSIYSPTLPEGWQDSIESFYKAGLSLTELTRALAIAMTKSHIHRHDKFRYMCGICWSVLREIQAEALTIVEKDE